MRYKLQKRTKNTLSPALRLQAVGLAAVLLLPWLATVIALPGVALATGTTDATNTAGGATAGFPPGYSTCPQKLTYVGWVELQSQGERTRSPLSNPGTICLSDGYVSYDTDLYVILSPTPGAPSLVEVVVEQWTPGTVTTYVNVTGNNGTVSVVPEQTSVQLDPQWSNGTAALIPGEQAGLIIPLPNSNGSYLPMVVTIDNTTWHLIHISPPQSSFAAIYGEYGLNMTLEIFGLLLLGFFALMMVWAKNFARKYHRAPRVPYHWWPAVMGGSPIAAFMFAFIPFDRFLGALGPVVLPGLLMLAAAPYAPNIFADAEMCLILSYKGDSLKQSSAPLAVLPLVPRANPICCAVETWGEWWHCARGLPLPEVRRKVVTKGKVELVLDVVPIPVTDALTEWYSTDAKLFLWQRSDVPIIRVRHHYERVMVSKQAKVEKDGVTQFVTVQKRTILPRHVPGYLVLDYPPAEDVLSTRTGFKTLEERTDTAKVYELYSSSLRSQLMQAGTDAREEQAGWMEEARYLKEHPRTLEEITELVAAQRKKVDAARGEDAKEK